MTIPPEVEVEIRIGAEPRTIRVALPPSLLDQFYRLRGVFDDLLRFGLNREEANEAMRFVLRNP